MREEGSRLPVTYLKLEMERGRLRVLGINVSMHKGRQDHTISCVGLKKPPQAPDPTAWSKLGQKKA